MIARGVPLIVICAQAPLADDGGPVAAAVVGAGRAEIPRLRVLHAIGPFEIAMVVVGHEVQVRERLVGITRAPFLVHNLDMEEVVGGNAKIGLRGANAVVCTV